jgi:tetratricopeptide (TPR) repeat protein
MTLDDGAAAEIAKRLAALRESQGDAAGVIQALERGFSAHPEDVELRDRLVKGYEERADWEHAARVLGRAFAAVPGERQLLLRLIEARRRAGGDREAIRELDVAVAASPDDAELLLVRAGVRERLSDQEGALTDLERATSINSAHVNALIDLFARMSSDVDAAGAGAHTIRLVDALLRVNRPKQARRELERLLARSPNHREALGRLASVAAVEGNWKSAAETYRKLLAMIENSSSPQELARVAVATAEACERGGVLAEAREQLARVVEVVAQSPGLLSELARLYQALKDWPRLAAILMARAEQEEGTEAKADLLFRAAQLQLDEASDPAGALPLLDSVRAVRPDSVEVRLLWARAQVALGGASEALKLLYDTLEQCGKRSTWLSRIYLEIGKAHLAVDELPEARFALESGFGSDWRTGDIAMLLGLVALDLGEDKTAERAFSAVTALPPRRGASGGAGADAASKATAYYHLAAIAMGKGDLEKARRMAGKALGGEPGNLAARALLESLDSEDAVAAPGASQQ